MNLPGCGVTQVTLIEPRVIDGWGRQASMSVNGPDSAGRHEDVVVRKAEHGWVVGDENVSDLTSAMVLADLFAADQADGEDSALDEADDNGVPRPIPGAQGVVPVVSGIPGTADQVGE